MPDVVARVQERRLTLSTITLPFSDSGGRVRIRMPRRCIVCGDASCSFKNVTFSSRFIKPVAGPFGQDWRRYLHTTVPLCESHRGHFEGQLLRGVGTMAAIGLFALAIGVAGFSFVLPKMLGTSALWGLAVAAGLAGFAIVVLVLLSRGAGKGVTCRNLTEKSITLVNVHRKFARAVEEGDWADEDGRADEDEEDRPRNRRRPDEQFRPPSHMTLKVVLAVGGLMLMLACGGVVAGFRLLIPPFAPPGRQMASGPENQPDGKANPLPIDPGWNDAAMRATYLTDLPEYDAFVGWGKFGKGGAHGFGYGSVSAEKNPVLFKGKESPRALSMAPPSGGASRVKYRLEGHKLLRGTAAMSDLPAALGRTQAASPFTFYVLGDGRLLWVSTPMQRSGDSEAFRLSVNGVKELELRVGCRGSFDSAWAVWLDPYLLQ
jgi:hypothetical protein